METMNGIYYERRQKNIRPETDERRIFTRRRQNSPFLTDRRRLASEVRRSEREPLEIPVLLKVEGREHSGYTQNINLGGISIFSQSKVEAGSALTLRFYMVDFPGMKVAGQVIYCRQVDLKGSYSLGIKFWGINDIEREMLKSAIHKHDTRILAHGNKLLSIHIAIESPAKEGAALPQSGLKSVTPTVLS